jgi:UDP-N-acetylmuramate dehydrogenase
MSNVADSASVSTLAPKSVRSEVSLSKLNTLRLKGHAKAFSTFSSFESLVALQRYAQQLNLPIRVLGGGSNILLAEHVNALVVQSSAKTINLIHEDDTNAWVDVDAGVDWHQWVCASNQYGYGLENLALIPGLVGAAPVQNIGAYGVEVGELIEHVVGYQLSTKQLRTLTADECRFSYRQSVFKREFKNDFVILRVRFRLSKIFSPKLNYAPLDALDIIKLTSEALIQAVVDVRNSKLPDPALIPNAGSFFHNPVVSTGLAEVLHQQYPAMPQYPQTVGVKLAAGWLIDQCGYKGKAIGPVAMYEKQALVLTTQEGATLAHVRALQEAVQYSVNSEFGVWLEPEPQVFD